MSKGQKVDPSKEQGKSLTAVRAPSVGESALTSEATGLMDWIHKGDYTSRPKNIFFNYADPAAMNDKRNLMMNAGAQGVGALGQGANANLLALNKQNLADSWARDTAGQYERDVGQAGLRAGGILGDVAGLENQRELSTLGSTTSSYNQQLARPKWWETMIQGAGNAVKIGLGAGG